MLQFFMKSVEVSSPYHLKLMQKVTSTHNLRSDNKAILINANQQAETFQKQSGNKNYNIFPTMRFNHTMIVFKLID